MDMVKTNSQGTKPIDQPRGEELQILLKGNSSAALPMQTISLPADPMPIKEQPQEYAEEKIEIQPMDTPNPYIPFTLNNYNPDNGTTSSKIKVKPENIKSTLIRGNKDMKKLRLEQSNFLKGRTRNKEQEYEKIMLKVEKRGIDLK